MKMILRPVGDGRHIHADTPWGRVSITFTQSCNDIKIVAPNGTEVGHGSVEIRTPPVDSTPSGCNACGGKRS